MSSPEHKTDQRRRKTSNPFGGLPFQTRSWRSLYLSKITNLEELRQQDNSASGIVTIATKPCPGMATVPAEVAISFLPLSTLQRKDDQAPQGPAPKTLRELREQYPIQTHSIRIADRELNSYWKKREVAVYGDVHTVDAYEVEDVLIDLLDSMREVLRKVESQAAVAAEGEVPKERLIFAGFDLIPEFKLVPKLWPRVLQFFDSWMDVQEIVRSTANAECPIHPGMLDSLLALGFGDDKQAIHHVATRAGSDTIRTMAIFVHLFRRRTTTPLRFEITGLSWSTRALKERLYHGKLFTWRPLPKVDFPYTSKVSLGGSMKDFSRWQLLEHFASYDPVAVGVRKSKHNPEFGWVCLPSLEMLRRFVAENDGRIEENGKVWEVTSALTPEEESRSLDDWDALRQALEDVKVNKRAAEDEAKREARRKKKEALNAQAAALEAAKRSRTETFVEDTRSKRICHRSLRIEAIELDDDDVDEMHI